MGEGVDFDGVCFRLTGAEEGVCAVEFEEAEEEAEEGFLGLGLADVTCLLAGLGLGSNTGLRKKTKSKY